MADGAVALTEIKAGIDRHMSTVDAFHKKVDEQLSGIQKKFDDVVTKEALDRIAKELTETKAFVNDNIAAIKRAKQAGEGDLERKELLAGALERYAVDQYIRTGKLRVDPSDTELKAAMEELEVKDLNTVIGEDGGYAVLPEYVSEMIEIQLETSPLRDICQVREIGGREIQMPVDMKGATVAWINELGTRTGTNTPTLQMVRGSVDEVYALPQVTLAMLEDGNFDVESWLADSVSEQFELAENLAFVSGDGNGKPRGFTTYGKVAAASYDAKNNWGSHAFIATGASGAFAPSYPGAASGPTAAQNGADKLIELIFEFKKPYRANLDWAMTKRTLGKVRTLKDGDGNYVMKDVVSMDQGIISMLLGYPVEELEDMDEIGADSFSIALGDFYKGYLILDRLGIQTRRDEVTKPGFVIFHFRKRVGGFCTDFDALKFLKFGTS